MEQPAISDGVTFDNTLSRQLPSQALTAVIARPGGDLWIGYGDGSVSWIHNQHVTTYKGNGLPPGAVYLLACAGDGTLWSVSSGGMARFAQGTWEPIGKETGYDGGTIDFASVAKDGRLWFVTGDRYFVLRQDAKQFVQLDKEIFATQVMGISQYVSGLDNNGTYLIDKSGSIWVASRDGVERVRWLDEPSGRKRKVTEIYGTAQGLLGSASGNGFEDREGNLWLSTTRGIEQFRRNRFTPVIFPNSVYQLIMAMDAAGVVWTGDEWGAYRLTDRLSRVPALGDHISAIAKDRSGTLWVAGGAHSARLHTVIRGKVASVPVPRELETADTEYNYRSMATDGEGALWVSPSPPPPSPPPRPACGGSLHSSDEVGEQLWTIGGGVDGAEGGGQGNTNQSCTCRTQSRESVSSGLERVRERAKQEKKERFTALLHHVDVGRLRTAYGQLRRTAAPGVDGLTWKRYGQNLEVRLTDLHARIHCGAYKAQPSQQTFIPKEDGQSRPLGVASLEDKIVQRAVVEVLECGL